MSAEHAPGPWKAVSADNGSGYLAGVYDVVAHDGQVVATTAGQSLDLIVAAPDLLALVIQYRDDLRHPPTPDSVTRRLQAIDAAIARATGAA
jgi:hypothetical protein